jgi:alpha-D-ribose 1-methylphosphonate 5-triphosphate synthase subunit PhnH
VSVSEIAAAPGLADPVGDAQQVFRRLLDAFAHPGRVVSLPASPSPPPGLFPSSAALALTLLDHSTPLFLDAVLAREEIVAYLRFHSGAPIVASPSAAGFALIGEPRGLDLAAFSPGDPERPERSATVILQVAGFEGSDAVRLTGPGIKNSVALGVEGIDAALWRQWRENGALYPCGVDLVLAAPAAAVALPRSVRVEI